MDIVPTDHIDDSRVTEILYVPKESIHIVVEALLESSIHIFVVNLVYIVLL